MVILTFNTKVLMFICTKVWTQKLQHTCKHHPVTHLTKKTAQNTSVQIKLRYYKKEAEALFLCNNKTKFNLL